MASSMIHIRRWRPLNSSKVTACLTIGDDLSGSKVTAFLSKSDDLEQGEGFSHEEW